MGRITTRQGLTAWLVAMLLLVVPLGAPGQPAEADVETRATAFVDAWLDAWARQDTEAYLAAYAPGFAPAGDIPRDTWAQGRIRALSRPARIAISRDDITFTGSTSDTISLRFYFTYQSPDYADRTYKELVLMLAAGDVGGILAETNLAVEALPDARLDADGPAPVPEGSLTNADSAGISTVAQAQAPVAGATAGNPASPAEPPEVVPVRRTTAVNTDWVPPGFENLNQPQVTEIDVYYGGYFLTSVLAEFTDQQVTILDTAGLTAQVGNLKSPDVVQAQLNAPLDAHTELLCFSEFQTDCGFLETDSVGVIFDRSLLRLWLFIAPDLLQDADAEVIRFLPPSEAGMSFMNQSAVYFTTRELSLNTYNLFNNTLLSWGENRFSMRSNLVSDEGFDIDTLAFMREFRGKDYRLGLMRENANGFSFMNNERFAGAAFASSLLTRADLERSLGTEIELYFSTRSRVEIYQEGRLISSDYYNVGNQLLDTSDLPNGSYTIEIRIVDAAGNTTTEERYYSKTANIPPADQPLYFVHVGRLENDLDVNRLSRTGEDEFLVRGGYNMRLGQSLGGTLGFSVVEDTSFLELGLFKQGQSFELQANAAFENTGASGVDVRLRYRHEKFNLVLNGRQVFNGLEESQIGLNYQQYNGMVEIPTRYGYYSIFHRHVERPDSGRNLNTGLRYRTHNLQLPGGIFSSGFELSKNDDEVLAIWSFSWAMRNDNRSSIYTPSLVYANADSTRDSGLYGSYESNWYRGIDTGDEYIYTLRGDYDYQSSLEARMEANTRLGSADITARYNEVVQRGEMNGRLSTSFATSGRTAAIGGKRRSESAFLVRVEGEFDPGARFNILVNGSTRGQLGAGETLLVPVTPYRTYNVELQAVGDTLVNLDNRVYRETMYPGNVVNLSWASRIINIAVGRLVDANGDPLANAVIQNVVGIAMTDDNGIFQAEIDHDTTRLDVARGATRCSATFDNPRSTDTVMPLGTLVCR